MTAFPFAASRTNPLPSRLAQHRFEAVVTAVPVPIEEGHMVILHIPIGIQNKPRENVTTHTVNTHQPTWMMIPCKNGSRD